MSAQEFSRHRLNAKRLAGIRRFESHSSFVLRTSYERQRETDAILLQVLRLKNSLTQSDENVAELERVKESSKTRILSLEDDYSRLLGGHDARRRAQSTSSAAVGWGDIQNYGSSNSSNNQSEVDIAISPLICCHMVSPNSIK